MTEKNTLHFQMPNIHHLRVMERKMWTLEAMRHAILEMEAGRLSLQHAAKQF